MSYLRHWKLNSPPFRLPQSFHDVFIGGCIEEAGARLEFLVNQKKKLGLLVGPTGIGKSVLTNHFRQSRLLYATEVHSANASLFGQTPYDIAAQILSQLDSETNPESLSFEQNILKTCDLIMCRRTLGQHTLIVWDDATNLTESQLDLFARISRVPGVTSILNLSEENLVDLPRWIFDLSEMRVELPPWDLGLLVDYFDFAVGNAGGNPEIFSGQAITRIQELAEGIPRRIAQIADLSLVSGAVRRMDHISAEVVEEVCNEFTLSINSNFPGFWESQQLNA